MKKLSLNIDTKDLNLSEEEKKLTSAELFSNVVYFVIMTYSQQIKGLQKIERKQVYEIQKLLKEAIDNKSEEVEFEDITFGVLRKVFTETKLNPNSILERVEKNIDAVSYR